MVDEVADGIWIRQSEWVWTNSVVVRSEDALTIIDPGIHGAELEDLADHVDRLGLPVVAGFATHPHWDHLLWHPRFGDVPRWATAPCAELAKQARDRARDMAAATAKDVPLEVVAMLTPLPDDHNPLPGEVIQHDAHAVGHASLLLTDQGVLVAGDLFSDVLIPMLDPRQAGQLDAFEAALARLEEAIAQVDVLVPGHGAVATGAEVMTRFEADRAYLAALRDGRDPDDPRLEQDWVADLHRSNQQMAAQ